MGVSTRYEWLTMHVWLWNSDETSTYPLKEWDVTLAMVLKSENVLTAKNDLVILAQYQDVNGADWDEIERQPLWE
jgi:hypothetical protein